MTKASIEPDSSGERPAAESTLAKIEKLKHTIWERRPILGEIMRRHGQRTLADYARDFLDVNPSPRLDDRKPELIAVVERLLAARLGPVVAGEVAFQLKHKPLVSTIDHHGPIDHPFFVNANIVSSLPFTATDNPIMNYSVVFSFASVSVNNASAFPRGILFHGGMSPQEKILRLPILPDRSKMGVVYGVNGMTREDITKAQRQLAERVRAGEVAPQRAEAINDILEKHFANDDVLGTSDLTAQITKINFALWPKLFQSTSTPIPQLIYLDIESLVTTMLVERHLPDSTTLIHRLLLDTEFQTLAKKYFDDIPGSFSTKNNTGTYFFWGLDDKRRRVGLRHDGAWLVSGDGSIRIALTIDGLTEALRAKHIFPSMLLCYLMISLYYGMKCLGGFCQVNDLTMTKRAWQELLRDIGETDEAMSIDRVQTKELGGDGMVLAYQEQADGSLVAASGIDLMLDPGRAAHGDYREVAAILSLNDVMGAMLPEMYTVLYAAPEREADLANLEPAEILRQTGVEEKLRRRLRQMRQAINMPAPIAIKAKR